jgi:hypothetical protein
VWRQFGGESSCWISKLRWLLSETSSFARLQAHLPRQEHEHPSELQGSKKQQNQMNKRHGRPTRGPTAVAQTTRMAMTGKVVKPVYIILATAANGVVAMRIIVQVNRFLRQLFCWINRASRKEFLH